MNAELLWTYLKRYCGFAFKNKSFIIGGIAVYLYLYPAQLLLAATRGVQEAGLYRVALMPCTAYYAIVVAAFSVYFPEIAKTHGEKGAHNDALVRRLFILLTCMGIAGWIGMMGAKRVFLFLVGPSFVLSAGLAPALVVSKGIGGVGLLARSVLLAKGKETFVYLLFMAMGIVSVVANLVVIPRYGLFGAAMTEVAAESIHLIIMLVALIEWKT